MKQHWETIALALAYAVAAAIPLGLIFAAPVMREEEPPAPPPVAIATVCHIDRELIAGKWEDVSKCHEEAIQ